MAIRMPGGAAERAGIPVALFQVPPEYRHVSGTVAAQYDVHPDGRFLMIRRSDRTPRPLELRVTANWFEALRPAVAPRVP